MNKNNKTQFTAEEARKDYLDLFKEYLLGTLVLEESFLLEELNDNLIEIILDNQKFQIELEKVLYSNNEKLTNSKIILNKKSSEPSIGNWLKDFISQYGSGIFDNITLTKYITTAPNCKNLDNSEKKMVKKLLVLYRNLKFFPTSMSDLPAEKWEIIPLEKSIEEFTKARHVFGPPKTRQEKEVEKLKQMGAAYQEGSLERKALTEEIGQKQKIESLKMLAEKYQVDSLERKALAEEIRKLEK